MEAPSTVLVTSGYTSCFFLCFSCGRKRRPDVRNLEKWFRLPQVLKRTAEVTHLSIVRSTRYVLLLALLAYVVLALWYSAFARPLFPCFSQ